MWDMIGSQLSHLLELRMITFPIKGVLTNPNPCTLKMCFHPLNRLVSAKKNMNLKCLFCNAAIYSIYPRSRMPIIPLFSHFDRRCRCIRNLQLRVFTSPVLQVQGDQSLPLSQVRLTRISRYNYI